MFIKNFWMKIFGKFLGWYFVGEGLKKGKNLKINSLLICEFLDFSIASLRKNNLEKEFHSTTKCGRKGPQMKHIFT